MLGNVRQTDFAFGELSPDYAASEVEAKTRSLKKGKNLRILNSYGVTQRPGSRRLATLSGQGIEAELLTSGGEAFIGVIRAAGIDIYSTSGGLLQSIGGAPWSASEAMSLTWLVRADELYVAHHNYWTRKLTYTPSTGVWSLGLVVFDAGPGSSVSQPYYRFAAAGITMQPSALTGAVNVVFSAAVLQAAHVGIRFRYGGSATALKELQITGVTDGLNGTATIIDKLPPTYNVTVADASGYRIGEDVEGADSKAKGVVTNVAGAVVTVLMADFFEGFYNAAATIEYLVGPHHKSKITVGGVALTTPAASTVWDEAVFSDVRGYPGDVFEHKGRLGFTDLPNIRDAILLSAPGFLGDFDVGEGTAADAIFWRSANGAERILYGVSAKNLIVLTDRRVCYVPESDTVPVAADTFELTEIGPLGATTAFPVLVEDGVIYVEYGGNRIMGAYITGQLGAPWRLVDLSRRGAHLINNPISLAMTGGNPQSPERYVFVLNGDGTLACMFYDLEPARLGWTPWDTAGSFIAMVPIRGVIYAVAKRTIGGATVYLLERHDSTCQLDASTKFSDAGSYESLLTDDGEEYLTDAGEVLTTNYSAVPQLAGQTVKVIRGTQYLGEFTADATGAIVGIDAGDGDFEAGLHFDINAVLWPPEPDKDVSAMFGLRRQNRVAVRVKDSCVYTIGIEGRATVNTRPAYDQGDDITIAPPLRSELKRFLLTGWEHEPSAQILRPLPQPLTVLSVAEEVTVR